MRKTPSRLRRHSALLMLFSAAAVCQSGSLRSEEHQDGAVPIALVGSVAITRSELERAIGDRLVSLRSMIYEEERKAAEKLISEKILLLESQARGLTVEELLRLEVEQKIENYPRVEGLKQLQDAGRESRLEWLTDAFLNNLRAKYRPRILLEPPRVHIDEESDAASLGDQSALVTIVEFADFECEFCREMSLALKRIVSDNAGRVRLVFRHMPLQVHETALQAAAAAECAMEQGQFWGMHDLLFEEPHRHEKDDLRGYASALGLDARRFEECLTNGRHVDRIMYDFEQARAHGVSGVPAVLINGRYIAGARTSEELKVIVEEEIALTTAGGSTRGGGLPATTGSGVAPSDGSCGRDNAPASNQTSQTPPDGGSPQSEGGEPTKED